MTSTLLSTAADQWSSSPVWLKTAVVGGGLLVGGAVLKRLAFGSGKRDSPVTKDFKKGATSVLIFGVCLSCLEQVNAVCFY